VTETNCHEQLEAKIGRPGGGGPGSRPRPDQDDDGHGGRGRRGRGGRRGPDPARFDPQFRHVLRRRVVLLGEYGKLVEFRQLRFELVQQLGQQLKLGQPQHPVVGTDVELGLQPLDLGRFLMPRAAGGSELVQSFRSGSAAARRRGSVT
jgi:hypothetical protein